MKLTIPDALKADVPQTLWGRILSATPVVMTVLATALAGLASSEMTRAQYSRSLAAQQQSKAGDQWSFFQAKRLRGALQRSTLDILQTTGPLTATPAPALPPLPVAPTTDPAIADALHAVETGQPETTITPLIARLSDKTLGDALRDARDRAQAFDTAVQPLTKSIEQRETQATGLPDYRDTVAARLRFTAQRYDAEARLNQTIANLYELQVRKGNLDAERHHKRSQRFFYGMLAAQAAVIVATFALAARKRSLLWSLAAAAGMAAVSFAIYVYLFV